jgi:hypothetical protein
LGKESNQVKTTIASTVRLWVRALVASAAAPLLVAGGVGCAKQSADLRLTSLESKVCFRQEFTKAYVSKGEDGNTEIVLVSDETAGGSQDDSARVAAGTAISPGTDVRQVMHVRVLWKPQRGTKQSHPSFTNAGLHWYVLGGKSPTDVLEYTGAGFVALSDTPVGTQVTIRNATVKPVDNPRCSLTDPVGPSKLTGSFLATRSAKRVNDLLAEVRSAAELARSSEQAAAH